MGNTGDGILMAQAVGAALWRMWHYHGVYGFKHPDPAYPFGIRPKRLPDWIPGENARADVKMPWIIVDRSGRRYMSISLIPRTRLGARWRSSIPSP